MLTNQQKQEADQAAAELDDEKPERYADHWCDHRLKATTWTEKGFITTCKICGQIVSEQ